MSLADEQSHKSFRPMTTLLFWFLHLRAGLDPRAFHAMNLLLHGSICVCVALVARLIFESAFGLPGKGGKPAADARIARAAAVCTTILFAVHPMHTEAVSNITNLGELLSLLFQLIAFLVYVRGVVLPAGVAVRLSSFLTAILFVVLATGSKETGISVAGLLVLAELVWAGVPQAVLRACGFAKRGDSHQGPRWSDMLPAIVRGMAVTVITAGLMAARLWHQVY